MGGGGPISITRQGSELVIALCSDIHANKINVETKVGRLVGAWSTVWLANGRADLTDGETIRVGQDVPGMNTEALEPIQLDPGIWIAISITSANVSETPNIVGSFVLGEGGLLENSWLRSDGTVAAEPCVSHQDGVD